MSNMPPPYASPSQLPPAYSIYSEIESNRSSYGASDYRHPDSSAPSSSPSLPNSETQKEIKLWESSTDRRALDDMSDLYAIIKTTEHLETAYVRDAITQDEYTDACTRLISQYKTAEAALRTSNHVSDVATFISKYHLDCPRAVERLVKIGVPATVVHNTSSGKSESVCVAQTVQHFITLMDSLKLSVRAVDEIQPLLSELMGSLTQVSGLPPSFNGRLKMENWLRTLNGMRASDELNEDQVRQLSFELEQAYTNFMSFLNMK